MSSIGLHIRLPFICMQMWEGGGGHFYLAFFGPCGSLQTKIFHIVFVLFSQKSI